MRLLWTRIVNKIWWTWAWRFNPVVRAPMKKSEMCNRLGERNGYGRYLEIATNGTGFQFGQIDRNRFSSVKRLIYHSEWKEADDLQVDWTTSDPDTRQILGKIRDEGQTFDIIFIDSYHTYEASRGDLTGAVEILDAGGIIAVHDCCPPRKDLTAPEPTEGAWMGETYLAFLDFVRDRPELDYCVVETDFGVGLVWRKGGDRPGLDGNLPAPVDLQRCDYRDWAQFKRHKKQWLRLISVEQFQELFLSGKPES